MYFVKMQDGSRLAVEDLNVEGKKTVLLIHGWPFSKEIFEYQKTFLVAKNYRVITYDIRGFGNSQVTAKNYDYNTFAIDLYYVIKALDLKDITLVGFSMGGAIAVRYMAMFEQYGVGKLVLMGAAVPSFVKNKDNVYGKKKDDVEGLIAELYNDRPKAVDKFGEDVFELHHSKSFKRWFRNICYSASGIGTIRSAIALCNENVLADLKKITVPSAIFHGKLDKVCAFGLTKIMKNEIKNSILIPFESSGHGIFYDEKAKLNLNLEKFIES